VSVLSHNGIPFGSIFFRFRFPTLWHDTRSALLAAGTYKFVFEEKEAAEPAKEADAVEQSA